MKHLYIYIVYFEWECEGCFMLGFVVGDEHITSPTDHNVIMFLEYNSGWIKRVMEFEDEGGVEWSRCGGVKWMVTAANNDTKSGLHVS